MTCLHETELIRDDAEVHIDVCKLCKEKLIYRKCRTTGRIDNKRYNKDHRVDLLQEDDKLFKKYYGSND